MGKNAVAREVVAGTAEAPVTDRRNRSYMRGVQPLDRMDTGEPGESGWGRAVTKLPGSSV